MSGADGEQSQRSRNASSGIRPVTLRQLVNATRAHSEAPFHIGNDEVLGVVTVVQVVRVRRYDTATLLDLEDGTTGGKMVAKRWLNGRDSDGLPADDEQYYARIIGSLVRGAHETKNTLNVQVFQRVTDPHQLFLHILEAAFVSLTLERGPPPESVSCSVGSQFQSGGEVEQFAPPSAPTTPAVARTVRSLRASTSTPMQTPIQKVLSSGPATTSRPHTPPTPSVRPPTPPSPSPHPRTPPPPSPPSSAVRSPPSSPSPPPARASAAVTQAPSGSRRVSGIKRDPWAHLSALERAILLQIFNAPSEEVDVDIRAIARGVSHYQVTPTEVGLALDALTEKGFVVPLDNEHYMIKTSHYPTSS